MSLFSTFTLVPYKVYCVAVPPADGVSVWRVCLARGAAPPALRLWHLVHWVSLSCQRFLLSLYAEYFSVLNILKTVIRGRVYLTHLTFSHLPWLASNASHMLYRRLECSFCHSSYWSSLHCLLQSFKKCPHPYHTWYSPCCVPAQILTVPPICEHTLFWFRNLAGRILRSENSAGSLRVLFPLATCNMPFFFFFLCQLVTWVYFILLFLFMFLMFSTFLFSHHLQ